MWGSRNRQVVIQPSRRHRKSRHRQASPVSERLDTATGATVLTDCEQDASSQNQSYWRGLTDEAEQAQAGNEVDEVQDLSLQALDATMTSTLLSYDPRGDTYVMPDSADCNEQSVSTWWDGQLYIHLTPHAALTRDGRKARISVAPPSGGLDRWTSAGQLAVFLENRLNDPGSALSKWSATAEPTRMRPNDCVAGELSGLVTDEVISIMKEEGCPSIPIHRSHIRTRLEAQP